MLIRCYDCNFPVKTENDEFNLVVTELVKKYNWYFEITDYSDPINNHILLCDICKNEK